MMRQRASASRDKPYYYRPENSPSKNGKDRIRSPKRNTAFVWILVMLMAALLIGFILIGFFTSYFDIKNITVEGLQKHTAEDIVELSGIKKGEKLYKVNSSYAEKSILSACSEIMNVKVKKQLPGTVKIILTYDTPKYFTKVTGEYYTLSDSLRVLSRGENKKELEGSGLVYIQMPNIKRAVAGETLQFFGKDKSYITAVIDAFEKSSFRDEVSRIYIENKFDICIVNVGFYRIELGDSKDLELKLKMAEKVLDTGGYREKNGVSVNVTNVYESSVRVDPNLKIE
ncbi:MAG: FtsQ-type POTRA domain-containing protein [Clostridia bacterium]|nr:FtsQ-type POTRA domain-containing protein [Clostridia bacterium]